MSTQRALTRGTRCHRGSSGARSSSLLDLRIYLAVTYVRLPRPAAVRKRSNGALSGPGEIAVFSCRYGLAWPPTGSRLSPAVAMAVKPPKPQLQAGGIRRAGPRPLRPLAGLAARAGGQPRPGRNSRSAASMFHVKRLTNLVCERQTWLCPATCNRETTSLRAPPNGSGEQSSASSWTLAAERSGCDAQRHDSGPTSSVFGREGFLGVVQKNPTFSPA